MNKKGFSVLFLMALIIISGLSSCFSNNESKETKNAKNNLDWEGVYTGTVLLGSGHIADVSIKLNRDQSFEYKYEYLDKPYNPLNLTAPFRWDDTGDIIIMDPIDAPVMYKVEKDKLIRLDENYFALNYYILKKVR
jgi:uncharacterized lipoprotein NlpE involved in copper resistance